MRLLEALARRPVDHPPVWIMRQAGRYLPEYRELRKGRSFQECVADPDIATEITLQPLRRFDLDAAIVFQDIMTPLEAMGVQIEFSPGPDLTAMTPGEVAELPPLDPAGVESVLETIRRVRAELSDEVAVIGFAGAPMTVLAYLIEGGGSKDFIRLRSWLYEDPEAVEEALETLAHAMRIFLSAQIEAGADLVQLFDSRAGVLDRERLGDVAFPAARRSLEGVAAPTIYFAPGAEHVLDLMPSVGATCYGVDWRVPLATAWRQIGLDRCIQGNLDPAVLLGEPSRIRPAVRAVLEQAGGRPGHLFNLGQGIDRRTDPEHVKVLLEEVRGRSGGD